MAPGSAPSTGPEPTLQWVHRTVTGVTYGGGAEVAGTAKGAIDGFFEALALTWRLRETLFVLSLKDFKSRYRAQALGLVWSLAHPLVMMVTVTLAFQYILKIKIAHFPVFYLIGAVFWQFFTNGALATTGSMIDNAQLVKRTTFPRFLLIIAAVISQAVNLGMEFLLVFGFYFVFPDAYAFNITLVALPFLVLLQAVVLVGFGLTTSGLMVRYRDVYYIVTSLITVGFWLTPILYPTEMAPPGLQTILRLNPLTGVIEGARSVIMKGEWPNPESLVPAIVVATVLLAVGCAVFRHENLKIADYV